MTRKQSLVEIGRSLFEEQGYEATRVDDILRVSGMSKGGFYHYLTSKEEVLREIIRAEMAEVVEAMQVEGAASSLDRLMRVFQVGSAHLAPSAGIVSSLASRQARTLYLDELEAQFEHHFKPAIAALIEEGSATGAFRPVDPLATAEVFIAVNNYGNRQALLEQRAAGELQAFNRTALHLLMQHLGIASAFETLMQRIAGADG